MLNPLRQPGSVNLRRLLPSASFVGCADIAVQAVAHHTDDCTPGCLFAALPGTNSRGRSHVPEALLSGAAAILTDRPLADVSLPQCIVPNVRQAYGLICHAMYGNPSKSLGTIGVTGTNGKTTTTWILRSLLELTSRPAGVIGTIEYNDGIESVPAPLTTPDARTLAQVLSATKERKTSYSAIELSSHALEQDRTAGLHLDIGIITNITRDHIDYHGNIENYVAAKSKIAKLIKRAGLLILNIHDPLCMELEEKLVGECHTCTFGFDSEADISGRILSMDANGSTIELTQGILRAECKTQFIGEHNILNCIAAAAAAMQLGTQIQDIAEVFHEVSPVPGRLQRVETVQPIQVFVDYAHTDDAIKQTIEAVRHLTKGDVHLLFGAGGDRDREKRPMMAKAATSADRIYITSDNPRTEPQARIADDILCGFDTLTRHAKVDVTHDRRIAIEHALHSARPGDSVIIAGKGHEKYQDINGKRTAFDDVEVCQGILQAMSLTPQHAPRLRAAG